MSFSEIKDAAMKLSLQERGELVRDLLESVDNVTEAEHERLWLEEVGRRIKRVERGESQLIPVEEALARVREVLAKSA
jgi:putative addiction module component (TIGR02574 family)